MSENINLLKGSRAKRFQQEKYVKILKIVSFVSLGFVVIASILLFYINASFSVESLRQEEAASESSNASFQKKAEKLLLAKNRISDILEITKKRTVFDDVITEMSQIIPKEVKVESINLDKKKFTLTVVSSSLLSINKIIEGIDGLLGSKKIFSKVILDGLTIDPKSGNYTISLSGDFL